MLLLMLIEFLRECCSSLLIVLVSCLTKDFLGGDALITSVLFELMVIGCWRPVIPWFVTCLMKDCLRIGLLLSS